MAAMQISCRRQPFAALDLPKWARMSDEELDALSDSDSEFSEAPSMEDVEDFENESTTDFEEDSTFEEDDFESSYTSTLAASGKKASWADMLDEEELNSQYPVVAKKTSWADLLDEEEEEAMFAMDDDCCSTASTCASPGPIKGRICWADLADSEDHEIAVAEKITVKSWADLADDEDCSVNFDLEIQKNTTAILIRPRWADMLDDDDF